MNILYCGDKNIEDGLIISILSLLKYNKNVLNIYVLTMNIKVNDKQHYPVSKEVIDNLDKLVKQTNKASKVTLFDITDLYNDNKLDANLDTRFTPYCMLRLYADLIEELPDKLLYLDNDVVANNDYSELYNIDNTNYELVGVLDAYGSHIYKKNIFKRDYINSGVLLLNLKLIKQTKLFSKARLMCQTKKMLLPDQSALNELCSKKLIIDRKYNEQIKLHDNTVFRHFSTTFKLLPYLHTQTIKPWNVNDLHSILQTYAFDDILEEYYKFKGSKQMKKIIPVFYTIDDNYAKYAYISIMSLIDHTSNTNDYIIHIVYKDLSIKMIDKLKSLETSNVKIEFNEMNDKLSCITNKDGNKLRENLFTLTIYFRLFIPEMFKQYDKCIYLDSDTVLLNDVAILYDTDLEDNYIGAVQDKSVDNIDVIVKYMNEVVGVTKEQYINSGVLVLDTKKLRQLKLGEKFMYLYNKYHFQLIAPDQDYINALCKNKIKYLSFNWDAMPAEGKKPISDPYLVHYNLYFKPWHYSNIDYENYFWKYAKKTEFYEELINIKNNYSEEQKKEDKENLNTMFKRALELCKNDNNFKTIFDSGKESRL